MYREEEMLKDRPKISFPEKILALILD